MNQSGYFHQKKKIMSAIKHKQQLSFPASKQTEASKAKMVTMDRSLWAQQTRFKWIFWLSVLISAAFLLASCKNNGQNKAVLNPSDTAGLAAFNAQKTADSLAALSSEQPSQAANSEQRSSSQAFTSANDQGNDESSGAVKSVNDDNGKYVDDNSAGAVAGDDGGTEATTAKKKKFSNAAKGALIGAGSGAVIGAIVDKKNRGLGAVIGAAVGGGAGYGIGKHKDNKKAKEGQ